MGTSREVSVEEVWAGFAKLMDSPITPEEAFHQYMVRYPALIPVWFPTDNVVYSKFRLGSQHVADFAFARDDSPGFRWHFIEIERPQDRLFTRSGNPTARLAHALRQLHDWGAWFEENRDHVSKYFPHADYAKRFSLARPHLTLIIGRREEIDLINRPLMRTFGGEISIRTFDSLQSNLRSAWLNEEALPLRCCSQTSAGLVELSSMRIDIRYHVTS